MRERISYGPASFTLTSDVEKPSHWLETAIVDFYGLACSRDFCAEQRIADISYFLRTGM